MADTDAEKSIYDAEVDEEDLWFLPPPPEDVDPPSPPWAGAAPRPGASAQDLERAEAGQGRALAEAAAALARLDQALAGREAALERLAGAEIAGLSWAEGQRLAPERIALFGVLRLSAADSDHRDLARAEWARARLLGHRDARDPEAFLGRGRGAADGLDGFGQRPVGQEWRALLQEWQAAVNGADLHPISRAALAFHLWRQLGLSGGESVHEPALLAARIGAEGLHNLPFLPLAMAGVGGLQISGPPGARLPAFLQMTANASRAALLLLGQLSAWEERALAAISPLSGRTPPALIKALARVPVLSAMQAEALTGASRAAVSRNLERLVQLGLAREITGQSRYRFWKAAL